MLFRGYNYIDVLRRTWLVHPPADSVKSNQHEGNLRAIENLYDIERCDHVRHVVARQRSRGCHTSAMDSLSYHRNVPFRTTNGTMSILTDAHPNPFPQFSHVL